MHNSIIICSIVIMNDFCTRKCFYDIGIYFINGDIIAWMYSSVNVVIFIRKCNFDAIFVEKVRQYSIPFECICTVNHVTVALFISFMYISCFVANSNPFPLLTKDTFTADHYSFINRQVSGRFPGLGAWWLTWAGGLPLINATQLLDGMTYLNCSSQCCQSSSRIAK